MFNPEIHKKLIFLDIDGVLNNHWSLSEQIELDHNNVMNLQEILDRTGAVIVLSSTWRNVYSKSEMEAMLSVTGLRSCNIVGSTPDLNRQPRGAEIQEWLDTHPGWNNYIILDDDDDMLSSQLPFFHNTWVGSGLIRRHVGILVESLNTGNPINDTTTRMVSSNDAIALLEGTERSNHNVDDSDLYSAHSVELT